MADNEEVTKMPEKHLVYKKRDYEKSITPVVDEFKRALEGRSTYTDRYMLPNLEAISNAEPYLISVSSTSSATVYQIKVPGFFYYQHYKGSWSEAGHWKILVCANANFTGQVYELMNSQGASGSDNGNLMFPIRPGSNTYIMVVGTLSGNNKALFFVPAWNNNEDPVDSKGSKSVPSTVVSGTPLDDGFKACFK